MVRFCLRRAEEVGIWKEGGGGGRKEGGGEGAESCEEVEGREEGGRWDVGRGRWEEGIEAMDGWENEGGGIRVEGGCTDVFWRTWDEGSGRWEEGIGGNDEDLFCWRKAAGERENRMGRR